MSLEKYDAHSLKANSGLTFTFYKFSFYILTCFLNNF